MLNKILYTCITLLLVLVISSCGENSNRTTVTYEHPAISHNNTQPSVELVADKTQATADSKDSVTLTATVKDVNGTPIPQQAITFNVSPGTNPYITLGRTDNNGLAVLHLSCPPNSPTNKIITVTATSGGLISNTVTITYSIPPPAVTATVTLIADKSQAIADGKDKVFFTATVKDENGKPITGQAISFNATPGADPHTAPINTNNIGEAVIQLSCSPKSLNDIVLNVTATSGGIISNTVTVTYSAPLQVAPAKVDLTSDKITLLSDGIDKVKFTITATDSTGTPLPGQNYDLHVDKLGPFILFVQRVTNSLGQAHSDTECKNGRFEKTCPSSATFTATINGVISNAISIAINPP
jgi:adhesin/invasin